MFHSKKHNLLFIASPKTGTVSIHEALQKIDPKGERNKITLKDRVIEGSDTEQGILGHARARELKKVIGEEKYSKVRTIAFLRNPYSKLVSSYFFIKNYKFSDIFKIGGRKKLFKRRLNYFLSALIAKMFSFQVWAFIYPYRSNVSYVTDYDGNLIVKHLGRTEHLHNDFHLIM